MSPERAIYLLIFVVVLIVVILLLFRLVDEADAMAPMAAAFIPMRRRVL